MFQKESFIGKIRRSLFQYLTNIDIKIPPQISCSLPYGAAQCGTAARPGCQNWGHEQCWQGWDQPQVQQQDTADPRQHRESRAAAMLRLSQCELFTHMKEMPPPPSHPSGAPEHPLSWVQKGGRKGFPLPQLSLTLPR